MQLRAVRDFSEMYQDPYYTAMFTLGKCTRLPITMCALYIWRKNFLSAPFLVIQQGRTLSKPSFSFLLRLEKKTASFVPKSKNGKTKNSFGPARYHKKQDTQQRPSQPQLQIKMQNRNGYRSKDSETNPEEYRENNPFGLTYHIRGKEYLAVGNKSRLKFFLGQ